jgi:hypothetical protein
VAPRPPTECPEDLRVSDKDYYSFEEVLQDLKLEENELKRLVSAGEIRAFRDKNTMRFKAEDVARLKSTRGDADDIQVDDLELDLDDVSAVPAAAKPAEDLVLEDAGEPAAQVEELDLAAEAEASATAAPARGRTAREGGATAGARRSARAAAAEEPEGKDSPLTLVALVGGVLLLLAANFVVLDAVTGAESNPLSGMVANMFG